MLKASDVGIAPEVEDAEPARPSERMPRPWSKLASERQAHDHPDEAAEPGDLRRSGSRRSAGFWNSTPVA